MIVKEEKNEIKFPYKKKSKTLLGKDYDKITLKELAQEKK